MYSTIAATTHKETDSGTCTSNRKKKNAPVMMQMRIRKISKFFISLFLSGGSLIGLWKQDSYSKIM